MKIKLALILTIFSVFAASCGTHRVEQLTERTKKYNRAVRWSSVAAAGTMMAPKVRRELTTKLSKRLSLGKVVEYSVVDLGVNEEKTEAAVLVEYSFYRNIDLTLRYRQELQTWKFSKDKKEWFLHEARLMASQ